MENTIFFIDSLSCPHANILECLNRNWISTFRVHDGSLLVVVSAHGVVYQMMVE
jgi:hypothetical protein